MTRLRIDSIRVDGGTQMRVGPRNPEALRDYEEAIQSGAQLPPVTVFHDGREYWLADGFHRWSAHKVLNLPHIEAEVREGSKRDAILFAVGANASHGLRRTNKDKRQAVETLLKDEEWSEWSNREIARRCSVDEATVRNARQAICGISADGQLPISNKVIDAPAPRTVQRGGTTFTQNTANIGQRPSPASQPAPQEAREPDPSQQEPETLFPPLLKPSVNQQVDILEPAGNDVDPPFPHEGLYPREPDPQARLSAEQAEKGLRDIHNALERLLKHERDGRNLLSVPDPYTLSVRNLARHARTLLDDWLDEHTEKEARTITLEALN